ncbi:piriformospora indica-insensitive protein 2 [Heracleum sosnowskyi]|uniref:Piriformospora indica-insensitive protein 2 n=1 Tax=Heracleum sosnowskyi TaxID=360622 RepID=A0AAD8GUY0_9APIA|nr:piriformospora indica-insensitive protein 2 [Heracleum sosnowskyi]
MNLSHLLSLLTLSLLSTLISSQPFLNSLEQESLYQVLESINSDISWRSLFPDDLCYSSPHGVVCEYFMKSGAGAGEESVHVTELSFGFISDYSSNPPCNNHSKINVPALSAFKQLKKLLFYKCFTGYEVPVPEFEGFGGVLEDLVFIENPSLVGPFKGDIRSLGSLKRFVLVGSGVSGWVPHGLGELSSLEQVTLSRNNLSGDISRVNVSKLRNLKVLDLSYNGFFGYLPESFGGLESLLKLDLSYNEFSGEVPESFKGLKKLEFLDLSYNKFFNCGVPLVLGEMSSLKEVYLSGNDLRGEIPEIWENLGGISGLGLSRNGLVGNIPGSMGLFLKNLCYLGLDNNKLEGSVPSEFGTLQLVSEFNLENNSLSGKIPFDAKFVSKVGKKLKLKGNSQLCVEEELRDGSFGDHLKHLKLCKKPDVPRLVLLHDSGSSVVLVSGVAMAVSWGLILFLVR